jgi:probable addiction module antidote protein
MSITVRPLDLADLMKDERTQAFILADAAESGDPQYVAHALGTIARARGMTQVAKDAGVTREALYKALSSEGDPRLSTLLGVIKALNLTMSIHPAKP